MALLHDGQAWDMPLCSKNRDKKNDVTCPIDTPTKSKGDNYLSFPDITNHSSAVQIELFLEYVFLKNYD